MNGIAKIKKKDLEPIENLSLLQLATYANNSNKVLVPEVRGLSMRKTMTTFHKKGLKYKINGSGKVFWQHPKPGQMVNIGTLCEVGLK